MLYKKYHRNFVKQFKGTKFKDRSPYDNSITVQSKYDNNIWLTIVFYNGKINDNIKIEDAV